jgi:hypothetical protein
LIFCPSFLREGFDIILALCNKVTLKESANTDSLLGKGVGLAVVKQCFI